VKARAWLAALALAGACAQPRGAEAMSDAELVRAVEKAVQDRAAPADVEARVGQRALVNTARDGRGPILDRNLATDEQSSGKLPHLPAAREVVFWRRPLAAPNPRLVGIEWLEAGPQLFFAVLLPH
jgi:hypothetical protein